MANMRELDVKSMPDLRELFYAATGVYDTCVAFHEKKQGFYQHISYGRLREETEALGTALGHSLSGVPRVLIIGKNSYAWVLAYLAVLCGVGVPVPADEGLDAVALAELCREADIGAVLYDAAARDRIAALTDIPTVCFDAFSQLICEGRAAIEAGDRSFCSRAIDPATPAAIFYTSGTTGRAKGVVLSHRNLLSVLLALGKAQPVTDEDIFLSVMPLSHIYECVLGLLLPLSRGASIAFSEGVWSILRNMREIHPTVMVTIPYLAEKIYEKFWQLVTEKGNETAVRRAIAVSDSVRPLSARQALKERLLASARAPFGGALRYMTVVGGFLPTAVCRGLRQIGIFAAVGYGITECAGLAAINTLDCHRDGTAGMALSGLTVDIYSKQADGSGEIRLKGDSVMLGYDGDASRTAEVLRHDWYYTGDFGRIDGEGYLHVIGRRQNCIERADGTLISPEELELLISQSPLVREVAVAGVLNGEGKDYEPAALIIPDLAYAAELFGIDHTGEQLEGAVGEWLGELNKTLPTAAQITLFALRATPFPKNAAGRVLRATLARELAAAMQP